MKYGFCFALVLLGTTACKKDLNAGSSDVLGTPPAGQTEFKINGAFFMGSNVGLRNQCVIVENNFCTTYTWQGVAQDGQTSSKKVVQVDKKLWCKVYTSSDYTKTTIRFASPSTAFNANSITIQSSTPFAAKKTRSLGYTVNLEPRTGYYMFDKSDKKGEEGTELSFGVSSTDGNKTWTVWPLSRFNCEDVGMAYAGYEPKNSTATQTQKVQATSPDKADVPSTEVLPDSSANQTVSDPKANTQSPTTQDQNQNQTQTQSQSQQQQQQQIPSANSLK